MILSTYFDVKDAPRPGRLVVKNNDKITEIIEIDWHINSRNLAQKRINQDRPKNSFKPFAQNWISKESWCLGATVINTKKNMINLISICEFLAKRNEIKLFLKRIVIGDEKLSHTTTLCKNDYDQKAIK